MKARFYDGRSSLHPEGKESAFFLSMKNSLKWELYLIRMETHNDRITRWLAHQLCHYLCEDRK